MAEKTRRQISISVVAAQPDDYPAVAHMLGENFNTGKYRLALGGDAGRRVQLIEALLKHGALAPGKLYVARMEDGQVAGTAVLKIDNAPISSESRRAALHDMAAVAGRARAQWATLALRLFNSPKVRPDNCYLDNLVVAPEFRRRGIALDLAHGLYQAAREHGKREMFADALSNNERVFALIRLEGWEVVHRNYLMAPITLPLLGFAGIFRVRKRLDDDPPATDS
ncbi:MAG: GNAT family N-acetyltransferase [Anaerolineae bacterium]|nr:GNAT family N-acetyltransferase [Anaerolineae bacterium]